MHRKGAWGWAMNSHRRTNHNYQWQRQHFKSEGEIIIARIND
jgi:hypothetical protein